MSFTPENLCGFLIRSRLMTPEEMRNMYQRWQAEGKDHAGSLSYFTKWLAGHQYVTEYQAGLLAKGHADPDVFFLNQYKILDRIGRGRMAGVYKAVHTLGQIVAIKVLPPSRAKNPHMLGRFQREARIAVRFKHPNVVRAFQIGEAKGLYFLVMEYLEGETLEDTLNRRKKLPPAEAVRLVHQALTGLQHIHDLGIVHRDLKPANLMLVPARGEPDTTLQATVKILDIGLGRVLFEENTPPGEDKIELTGEGVILGTPDYLAPEQARDPRAIDIRADIYSLGCVLYHTLTGQPPFPDSNLINQMVRHATETPKPLQHFNPAIPDGLQQIVSYMLAKQPAQRYATPERAAQALQMFLIAGSQAARPLEEAPQMRKYLTWLETSAPGEAGSAAAPSTMSKPSTGALPRAAQDLANLPVATPIGHLPYASKLTPVPPARSGSSKKHKKHRSSKHASGAPAVIDVELVPIPGAVPLAPPAAPETEKTFGLSKREWTLVGIGAGGLLLAVIVGFVIASLFRSGS